MTDASIEASKKLRELSLRLVHKANASHIGSALSIADLLAVLVTSPEICNLPAPQDPTRDRLLLSKGHACVALYSALCIKGFFTESELMTYGDDFSPFMNHASHNVPGIEISTGALGHALSIGCGKALAAFAKKEDWHTFVILSDGEMQEGSNWESLMFASHHNLCNLTVIIDFNNLQSLASVDKTLSIAPLDQKLSSFGWTVIHVDGHSHEKLYKVLAQAKVESSPAAIIMHTTKGKGVSFMENSVDWHYKSPSSAQLDKAIAEVYGQ
jgi:transketolase